MSALEIINKARSLGVRLRLDGDMVKMKGPAGAVAAIKPEVAAHKPELVAYLRDAATDARPPPDDCVGALHDPDGGLYLPWGPSFTADNVRVMRAELVWIIEHLAELEAWPDEHREDVLSRAIRGPLSDLLPNIAYFKQRLTEVTAEAAARDAADKRNWRYDR